MNRRHLISPLYLLLTGFVLLACSDQEKNYTSPAGYDLNNTEKIIMPESLLEVSGIAFDKGKSDTLYAEQDEEGRLFYLKPGDQRSQSVRFGKHGDYEDLSIWHELAIVLRSDGTLFTFPLRSGKTDITDQTIEYKKLVPKGEYEGLYADPVDSLLYILCKHCDNGKDFAGGYTLSLSTTGISPLAMFEVDTRLMAKKTKKGTGRFHPSALVKNPWTSQWFILSSVDRMLVVANANWQVQEVHLLNPAVYHQPEGIAFDADRNLYISNEGDKIKNGNVLRIRYTGKN